VAGRLNRTMSAQHKRTKFCSANWALRINWRAMIVGMLVGSLLGAVTLLAIVGFVGPDTSWVSACVALGPAMGLTIGLACGLVLPRR